MLTERSVHGKQMPDVYQAQRIANALGATVGELWPLPPKEDER